MSYINDNIRLVSFALYCKEISADDHDLLFVKEDDINVLWTGYNNTMKGLKEKHFGDCTKDAISCKRCRADELIEDAKYIIEYWQNNDEIIKEKQIRLEEALEESSAMNNAIRDGSYDPTTVCETTSGQTLVRTVDRKTGKTWDELYKDLKEK